MNDDCTMLNGEFRVSAPGRYNGPLRLIRCLDGSSRSPPSHAPNEVDQPAIMIVMPPMLPTLYRNKFEYETDTACLARGNG